MLLTSLFTPSAGQPGALVAALWQGDTPPGLQVKGWYYLAEGASPVAKMLLLWEVADADERAWLEARMSPFGDLQTWETADSTPGMSSAMARDYDGFAAFLRSRGTPEEAIGPQLEVRRRGAASGSVEEAAAAAAAWAAEQGQGG